MDINKSDISSLRVLIQQLRVPELNYYLSIGVDAQQERILVSEMLQSLPETCESAQGSLIKHIILVMEHKALMPQVNNLAFQVDRVFDVWIRKNRLANDINFFLSKWRFLLFKIMLFDFTAQQNDQYSRDRQNFIVLISIIESIAEYGAGWSDKPERSKNILLDELNYISDELFTLDLNNDEKVSTLKAHWNGFRDKQRQKSSKVVSRLIEAEDRSLRTQFSQWFANNYINALFKKRQLPNSLQHFVSQYWVLIVAASFEKSLTLDLDVDKLSKNLIRTFCQQNEAAFKLAGQILDDVQTCTEAFKLKVPDNVWRYLEESLVGILQKSGEESKSSFKMIELASKLEKSFGGFDQQLLALVNADSLGVNNGDWFIYTELNAKTEIPVQLASIFEETQQMIFCNYLGIKVLQLSFSGFNECVESGSLKSNLNVEPFTKVFRASIKGLLKVSETQKKARIKAAEKAKEEAEKLLAEKLKAEEAASKIADEIAERTKMLLQKRADKLRLDKENEVLGVLSNFSLGAWISIKIDNEKQRFKLVVKLAATGKYIFVDKLGVKKKEYLEADLVQAIINQEIEILSDGAEFEDSLERVVSRLRMSK